MQENTRTRRQPAGEELRTLIRINMYDYARTRMYHVCLNYEKTNNGKHMLRYILVLIFILLIVVWRECRRHGFACFPATTITARSITGWLHWQCRISIDVKKLLMYNKTRGVILYFLNSGRRNSRFTGVFPIYHIFRRLSLRLPWNCPRNYQTFRIFMKVTMQV